MEGKQQSRREALAKRVYGMCWPQEAGWPTWCVAHEVAQRRAESVADFIIAEQERREVPLVRCLETVSRGHEFSEARESCSCHKCEAWRVLRNFRALVSPPQRTVEQIAADLKDWRKMPCTSVDALMDELAAALKRGKE